MKSRVSQALSHGLNRSSPNVLLRSVLIIFFTVALIFLYASGLSSNSGDDPSVKAVYQPFKSFAAAYTVTRTYTSKSAVVINNLWKQTQDIGGGLYHACALSNGKVYCWGRNDSGQLGDGTNTDRINPSPVYVGTSGSPGVLYGKYVTAIAVGGIHTCALAEGKAYCWGGNSGRLGNNSTLNSNVPVAVDATNALAGKTVTAISAGGYHTCAIASSQAYCWGRNGEGQLGNGQPANPNLGQPSSNSCLNCNYNIPVAVSGLSGAVTSIATGSNHTCAVSNGKAYCWGGSSNTCQGGRLGNNVGGCGTNLNTATAVNTSGVLANKVVSSVVAGASQSCAIADGKAYCWGPNLAGENGTGVASGSLVPAAVSTTAPSALPAGDVVQSIATGVYTDSSQYQTCAVANGKPYCWGSNNYGQLGDGTTTSSLYPVSVNASGVMSGKFVSKITPGSPFSCAIANGRAYCWGNNDYGQLGNGTTTSVNVPYRVNDSYY